MESISIVSSQNGVYSLEITSLIVSKNYKDTHVSSFGVSYIGKSANYLASSHSDKAMLSIWNSRCDPIYKVSLPEIIKCCVFQEDGGLLYAGGLSGTIYIWVLSTGQLLSCWLSHFKPINKMEIVRSNSIILSSSDDNYIQAFLISDLLECCLNMDIPKPIMRWQGHSGPVHDFVFMLSSCFSRELIISVGSDYTVNFLTFESESPVASLNISTELLSCETTNCGKQLFIGCGNGVIYCINIENKNEISFKYASKLLGHTSSVNSCKCIRNKLFSSGFDGVRIWNINSGTCIMQLTQFGNSVTSILSFYFSSNYLNLKLPPFKPLQKNISIVTEITGINTPIEDKRGQIKEELYITSNMVEYVGYIFDSVNLYSELVENSPSNTQFGEVNGTQLSTLSPESIIKTTIERCIFLENSMLTINTYGFEESSDQLKILQENILPFSMYSELKANKRGHRKKNIGGMQCNKPRLITSSRCSKKVCYSKLKRLNEFRNLISAKTYKQEKRAATL